MKTIVLVCDGMADEPIEQIGGRTPLEAAKTPQMNALAREGKVGLARIIAPGFAPASDVGNMAIMGYDPKKYYSGRAPLEAANMGVPLNEGDVAFRCNLVTIDGDTLVDYSAGHIKSDEAKPLIQAVGKRLGTKTVQFYPGIQYRHLVVFREPAAAQDLLKTACTPPHDLTGKPFTGHLPKGPAAQRLIDLMEAAQPILADHEVNQVRVDLKENPANRIWLWGQGTRLKIPTFQERWKLTGSVISAVDLVKGAGRLAGLEVLEVPGATGYYDTDYAAKAKAALKSLKNHDFVFVHVEAADEAGHNGDLRQKIAAIENFDRLVVGTILEKARGFKEARVLVIPDHPTPIAKKTHTSDPVPFLVWGTGIPAGATQTFGETQARESGWMVEEGYDILPRLLTEEKI
ncbi:MAG: cofactor-independent phosphoglycerate mutase [Candidatus Omnitrophica bacterium]|nr:cofactor-independent phosphoglycerate mutase [Candidatus Omnitrophota bacterium]